MYVCEVAIFSHLFDSPEMYQLNCFLLNDIARFVHRKLSIVCSNYAIFTINDDTKNQRCCFWSAIVFYFSRKSFSFYDRAALLSIFFRRFYLQCCLIAISSFIYFFTFSTTESVVVFIYSQKYKRFVRFITLCEEKSDMRGEEKWEKNSFHYE